jgi:hypothetical protein
MSRRLTPSRAQAPDDLARVLDSSKRHAEPPVLGPAGAVVERPGRRQPQRRVGAGPSGARHLRLGQRVTAAPAASENATSMPSPAAAQ